MFGRMEGLHGRPVLYFPQGQFGFVRVSAASEISCFMYHGKFQFYVNKINNF